MVDYFSLITRCIIEIYQTYEGRSKLSKGIPEDYTYGQIVEKTRNLNRSTFAYICFIEEFVNGFIKWFEFFSSLVRVLGANEYYRILYRKAKLEEVVDESRIDVSFLKFQIRSVLNTSFQDLKSIYNSLLERSKGVRENIAYLRSESSERFVETVENQARGWLDIHDEIYGSLQFIIKEEDESICIKTLTMVIDKCIDFFEKIRETRAFIKIPEEVWKNFMADDFVELFELFKEIKEDVIKFYEYATKVYEHASKCFLQVLTMLWGTEEEARHKLELLVKSEITINDLIPENFSLKDIEFGLTLAIFEWDQARLAGQVLNEKIGAFELIAKYVITDDMQNLYMGIKKRFELRNKYRKEIYDKMIEIQNTIHEIMKP
nr:hypothetical protein [Candidatus Freyarchaeota archaeon]